MPRFITLHTEPRDGAKTPQAVAINVDHIVRITSHGATVAVRTSDGDGNTYSASLEQVLALANDPEYQQWCEAREREARVSMIAEDAARDDIPV